MLKKNHDNLRIEIRFSTHKITCHSLWLLLVCSHICSSHISPTFGFPMVQCVANLKLPEKEVIVDLAWSAHLHYCSIGGLRSIPFLQLQLLFGMLYIRNFHSASVMFVYRGKKKKKGGHHNLHLIAYYRLWWQQHQMQHLA